MILFRQLFDPGSSTYTYLIADSVSREAVLVDPVFEQFRRDGALIRDLDLKLVATVETHVHADHITAGWLFAKESGSKIMISKNSGAEGADVYLDHLDKVSFGSRYLEVRETPGHTAGCIALVMDDESFVMTGDCLLVRGAGRTDFQGGSASTLYRSVHSQVFTLPDECLIYPGHDYRGLTVSSVREEKSFNPRLGGQLAESDFVGYMDNLGLAHPKKMDEAVPANMKCGQPDDGVAPGGQPDWAPVKFTFSGFWEIEPRVLEEHLDQVQILDVREPSEFDGPLGHISGAVSIPLGELPNRCSCLEKDRPIVSVCRAGGRSAQAINLLRREGIDNAVNLAGGMLRWRAENLPVENGAE